MPSLLRDKPAARANDTSPTLRVHIREHAHSFLSQWHLRHFSYHILYHVLLLLIEADWCKTELTVHAGVELCGIMWIKTDARRLEKFGVFYFNDAVNSWNYIASVIDECVWSVGGMMLMAKPKYARTDLSQSHSVHHKFQTDMGSNTGRRGQGPATIRLFIKNNQLLTCWCI